MKKPSGVCCGEFYSDAKCSKYVGTVWKLAKARYVIRGLAEFTGAVLWESAEFCGKEFKKVGSLNLGYSVVPMYSAA